MPGRFRLVAVFLIAGSLLPCAAPDAFAQKGALQGDYPSRPIRIVGPFTPGGQPDIFIRLIIPGLVESFRQLKRVGVMADIPTIAESGLPGFEWDAWGSLCGAG